MPRVLISFKICSDGGPLSGGLLALMSWEEVVPLALTPIFPNAEMTASSTIAACRSFSTSLLSFLRLFGGKVYLCCAVFVLFQ